MRICLGGLFALLIASSPLTGLADGDGGQQDLTLPQESRPSLLPPGAQGQIWASLWDRVDPLLQAQVQGAMERLGLHKAAEKRILATVLVDVTDVTSPRVAAVNGDFMMYAASLPKIAVLLSAVHQISKGELVLDDELRTLMEQMIRRSSNQATTEVMHRVGKENIALILQHYELYDRRHNGGLWVGKDYAKTGLWRRDPIHNLSHGATPMQVARFYYLMETERLVSPEHSRLMKDIMGGSEHINHKFVAALRQLDPHALMWRKSGSWRSYHADSILVKREGRAYIAVALSDSPEGKLWLEQLLHEFDRIVMTTPR